jgi:iron complex transport system substrate-binding protein
LGGSLLFLFSFFIISCGNAGTTPQQAEAYYTPQYAAGFYIEKQGADKLLHVKDPWQGAEQVNYTYRLCARGDSAALAASLMNIPVPVERAVCLSTTHLAFIDVLQETATVVGMSGLKYVSNPLVRERAAAGAVREVGFETGVYYEQVAMLKPDVVFAYGVAGEMRSVAEKLHAMGVRVVFIGDYLEENPLGKAETLLAFAAFYNKEDSAKIAFRHIAGEYCAAKNKIDTATACRPKVLLNAPWRSAWYVPGDRNYLTALVRDAGGEVLGCRQGRNSTPLSFEAAYRYAMQADYWLHPNNFNTLAELERNDPRFATIPAFRQHRVFNNTLRHTSGGGSDFWESGVVQPHIILRDMISILHPDLLPEHRLVYYKKL